jgi:hypothetical protein
MHPAAGRDVGVVEPDGTIVLRPAAVMTVSQARLLARPELTDENALAVDPGSWSQGGRPRKR